MALVGAGAFLAALAFRPLPLANTQQAALVIQETGGMEASDSEEWWVNSGAQVEKTESGFQTIQGELPWYSWWRIRYLLSNPVDTDNGEHPQNILRFVNKSKWENGQQTMYVRVHRLNMSASPERGAWSGIFFLHRYKDGDNLYYAGIRQDGAAVIKKKMNGVYYTMAYAPWYKEEAPYNREINPNLIPGKQWIGLRTLITSNEDGSVLIRLLLDEEGNGSWQTALEARDEGSQYGGDPIRGEGHGGMRSDFMDMEFRDYKVEPLS
ncbi:MAG TPA: hypothetical protein VFE94_02600 [Candidatus Paceibacterota bacterium]|nr:hypothetical protein [Candidatus Paceibacterota bacterium]